MEIIRKIWKILVLIFLLFIQDNLKKSVSITSKNQMILIIEEKDYMSMINIELFIYFNEEIIIFLDFFNLIFLYYFYNKFKFN